MNLCSSKVENGRTSLILFIQELIESFLMLLSIYVGWDSDCRVLTCLDMRAGIYKDTETTSLGFSVAKNGSFKSSVAGNLIDAGTRHCSMNCLTWGSLTLPREAGFMPKVTLLNICAGFLHSLYGYSQVTFLTCTCQKNRCPQVHCIPPHIALEP